MRIGDLARAAGISAQQVRNYVDLGVLPPVTRTASGYRVFTREHAEALTVVRRLADGHGWARTHTIMRAIHDGDVETALATLDRSHGELDRERAEIAAVLGAVGTVVADAAGAPRPTGRRGLRVGQVAAAVGVRTSALRLWEQYGLLRPAREKGTNYRVYDDAEVRRARVVALLRRGGYPLAIVAAVVDEMRTTGSPERVRAELAKREQDLHRRSLRRLGASAACYAYIDGHALPSRA
jgi:DNA-binding transcriptional MerR regulator